MDCSLLVNPILVGGDFTYVHIFVVADVIYVIAVMVVVSHRRP